MKHLLLLILLFVSSVGLVFAEEEIVFSGMPRIKISASGLDSITEKMSGAKALEFRCVITKVGDKYFWTTRQNVEMVPIESGAYITFIASTGAGYVRVIPSEMKKVASSLDDTAQEFDYVEHMSLGLNSVTYYGKRTK